MEVGLFGKKLGMTQIFDDQGSIIPVTLVEVKPCQVSQIKTIDSDSYNAIQIAYFEENLNRLTKPTLGHLKKSGDKGFKSFAEFRVSKPQDYKLGQNRRPGVYAKIKASFFEKNLWRFHRAHRRRSASGRQESR